MDTSQLSTPDRSKRSFDSDEELGRSRMGHGDWEFLVGTAISVYQNSGGGNNNWSAFEEQRTRFGQPTIEVSTHLNPGACCLALRLTWQSWSQGTV